jgi:DNA invertase Pin-like site-specific DNA recombinase
MSRVGYIRVSTVDQNTERQLKDIKLDKIFEDKCSGKNTNRPALIQLKEYVREGDTVFVHDISRMARNVNDLLNLIKEFKDNGVSIHFVKENLVFDNDKSNPMNDLMLTILGAIYQFERSMLLERQREGIAIAKSAGKYKGKQTVKPVDKIKQSISDDIACKDAMAEFNISKAYFYKIKKQMANSDNLQKKHILYVEVSPHSTATVKEVEAA